MQLDDVHNLLRSVRELNLAYLWVWVWWRHQSQDSCCHRSGCCAFSRQIALTSAKAQLLEPASGFPAPCYRSIECAALLSYPALLSASSKAGILARAEYLILRYIVIDLKLDW